MPCAPATAPPLRIFGPTWFEVRDALCRPGPDAHDPLPRGRGAVGARPRAAGARPRAPAARAASATSSAGRCGRASSTCWSPADAAAPPAPSSPSPTTSASRPTACSRPSEFASPTDPARLATRPIPHRPAGDAGARARSARRPARRTFRRRAAPDARDRDAGSFCSRASGASSGSASATPTTARSTIRPRSSPRRAAPCAARLPRAVRAGGARSRAREFRGTPRMLTGGLAVDRVIGGHRSIRHRPTPT